MLSGSSQVFYMTSAHPSGEEQLKCLWAYVNHKFKCKTVVKRKVLSNDPVFLEPFKEMTLYKYSEKKLL